MGLLPKEARMLHKSNSLGENHPCLRLQTAANLVQEEPSSMQVGKSKHVSAALIHNRRDRTQPVQEQRLNQG